MTKEVIRDNTVISIIGQKGSGKSFLAKQIIEEHKRVIAIDSQQEYDLEVVEGRRNCIDRVVKASNEKKFRLSLRLDNVEDDLELISLCETLTDFMLVLEETSRYVSASKLPDEVARVVRFGRHKAISQIYLARRASELHRDLTANSDIIISFHQHEPRDIKYLHEFMGDKAETAIRLRKYRFIAYGRKSKAPAIVIERLAKQKHR